MSGVAADTKSEYRAPATDAVQSRGDEKSVVAAGGDCGSVSVPSLLQLCGDACFQRISALVTTTTTPVVAKAAPAEQSERDVKSDAAPAATAAGMDHSELNDLIRVLPIEVRTRICSLLIANGTIRPNVLHSFVRAGVTQLHTSYDAMRRSTAAAVNTSSTALAVASPAVTNEAYTPVLNALTSGGAAATLHSIALSYCPASLVTDAFVAQLTAAATTAKSVSASATSVDLLVRRVSLLTCVNFEGCNGLSGDAAASILSACNELRVLNLNNCAKVELPPPDVCARLSCVRSLHTLRVSGCRRVAIESVLAFTRLHELEFGSALLSSLPAYVACSPLARSYAAPLKLAHSRRLRRVCSGIGALTELRVLDVRGNRFAHLPSELGRLRELTELNVCGNLLTALPTPLSQLPRLVRLFARTNALTSLPEELFAAPDGGASPLASELQLIDLSFNALSRLPDSFARCCALVNCDLSYNFLEPATLRSFLPPALKRNGATLKAGFNRPK